ncbi:DUF1634 domain-containing protein [Inconstantimicrobium mannanitabidum]|uniref:Membrane protein n=1 Tax=Inconstantimicrobium mannanitabidum TaxID=1604901 RepID=A0ACB5RGH3_9CLOT|nr:DUF1634 domain-containing protein [Clostridium sp. TW13]GKX68180.1 membrane protein [Clostridium sp. TW13]
MSDSKIDEMEIIISKFLKIGVLLSAFIIFIGFAMFLVTGDSGYANNTFPTNPGDIFKGLIQLKSYAIILTGLLLLIATPVFRVGVSIIVFIKEKDYLYVKITSLVFLILLISFALGKVE